VPRSFIEVPPQLYLYTEPVLYSGQLGASTRISLLVNLSLYHLLWKSKDYPIVQRNHYPTCQHQLFFPYFGIPRSVSTA
jgi:hypothetical protein